MNENKKNSKKKEKKQISKGCKKLVCIQLWVERNHSRMCLLNEKLNRRKLTHTILVCRGRKKTNELIRNGWRQKYNERINQHYFVVNRSEHPNIWRNIVNKRAKYIWWMDENRAIEKNREIETQLYMIRVIYFISSIDYVLKF